MTRTIRTWIVGLTMTALGAGGAAVRGEDAPPPPAETPKPETPPPSRQTVVLTPTREPVEALAVPAHVTVLTTDQLEREPWRDLADALSVQPGLFATRNSTSPQDVLIDARGFNNGGGNGQHLLVLVDDRKTNSVTGSVTDWASIPMEDVERVEIVRGPMASLYGDTAVAGVVHIITKEGSDTPVRRLSAEAGSFGTLRERLFVSGKEEGVTYAVYAADERSDGFRENSAYEGKNGVLRLGVALDDTWKLRARIGLHDDGRDRPGTLTAGDIAQFGRDASLTPGDHTNVFASDGEVGIERRTSRTMKGAGAVDERTSAFVSWTHGRSDSLITFVGGGTTALQEDSSMLDLTLQHTSLLRLLDPDAADFKTTVGADLGYETAFAAGFNNFPPFFVQDQDTAYRRRLLGVFAHGELAVSDELLVVGGGRLDRALLNFDQNTADQVFGTATDVHGGRAFDQVNPHLGVNYRWSGSTSSYAAWGRTMRYPTRDELLGFITASPELRPERAATWEVGHREEWSGFTGTLSLYRMDVDDEIFFVPPPVGAFAFGTNQNVPHIRHTGIEWGGRWQAFDPVAFTGGYTFTRTTIEQGPFPHHQLPLTPRHMGTAGTEVDFGKGFLLTTQTRIVGRRFLLNDLDNTLNTLPPYAVTNLELRWKRDAVQAWITAFNVADREYMDNGGLGGFPHGSRVAFNPAAGANFLAGVQVEF